MDIHTDQHHGTSSSINLLAGRLFLAYNRWGLLQGHALASLFGFCCCKGCTARTTTGGGTCAGITCFVLSLRGLYVGWVGRRAMQRHALASLFWVLLLLGSYGNDDGEGRGGRWHNSFRLVLRGLNFVVVRVVWKGWPHRFAETCACITFWLGFVVVRVVRQGRRRGAGCALA